MEGGSQQKTTRLHRVRKNLRYAMSLAWAASPRLLIRYSMLGMFNAIMPPVSVYLGAVLVNRIADARVEKMTNVTRSDWNFFIRLKFLDYQIECTSKRANQTASILQ